MESRQLAQKRRSSVEQSLRRAIETSRVIRALSSVVVSSETEPERLRRLGFTPMHERTFEIERRQDLTASVVTKLNVEASHTTEDYVSHAA